MITDSFRSWLWIIVLQRPITTICWGHRDSRLFLACGPALYVVRVEHRVASLQLLCQQGIASALREEKDVGKLNMPSLLCSYVTTAFIPTIKVHWSSIHCYAVTVTSSFSLTLFQGDQAKLLTETMFSLECPAILQPFPLFVLAPNPWPQQHPWLCQLSHSWEWEAPLHYEASRGQPWGRRTLLHSLPRVFRGTGAYFERKAHQ